MRTASKVDVGVEYFAKSREARLDFGQRKIISRHLRTPCVNEHSPTEALMFSNDRSAGLRDLNIRDAQR